MDRWFRHPLLALGFRPFFLVGAIAAFSMQTVWLLTYGGALRIDNHLGGSLWHGHEMIFGYGVAVIAGFLLTAVPNWTATTGLDGLSLLGLIVIWSAGRLVMFFPGGLPAPAVIAVDVAFLPALAFAIARPLIQKKNWRNIGLPILLLAGAIFNLLIHFGALGIIPRGTEIGMRSGIDFVIILIVVIGGRVVPFFTANALRTPARKANWTDGWALYSLLLMTLFDLIPGVEPLAGATAVVAAAINGLRMRGWQSLKTLAVPILWVLHLGYSWLVIGLALKGVANLTHIIPWHIALHALTAGTIGTFTIGMMSRVALGHTGRPLQVNPMTAVAYRLVSVAALLRLCAALIKPEHIALISVYAAGVLWAAAFLVFTIVYTPILIQPRVDARRG